MKFFLPSIFLLLVPVFLLAQTSRDSILLSERSIDRPLTLHKGQIRIEGGYGLSSLTRRFDGQGETVRLKDEGYSYVRHAFYFDMRYGILENLQLSVSTSTKKQTIRHEEIYTISATELTKLFEIETRKGFEDLLASLRARAPFTSKALDIIVTGGISVPIGSHDAATPNHSVTIESPNSRRIIYRYQTSWSFGTPVALIGGNVKYRTQYFAFTGSTSYQYPLKESDDVRWIHQLNGSTFEYRALRYTYQVPGLIQFQAEVERQLAPWFDLSILFYGERTSGGWEEINNQKVTYPDASFYSINPGYEILVTSKLWLRQRLGIALYGKNSEAPFSIYTSLVYNLFPGK